MQLKMEYCQHVMLHIRLISCQTFTKGVFQTSLWASYFTGLVNVLPSRVRHKKVVDMIDEVVVRWTIWRVALEIYYKWKWSLHSPACKHFSLWGWWMSSKEFQRALVDPPWWQIAEKATLMPHAWLRLPGRFQTNNVRQNISHRV